MNFYARWRFTALLAAMLLLLTLRLVAVELDGSAWWADLFGAVVLVAALLSSIDDRRFRTATLVLGVPAIFGLFGAGYVHEPLAYPLTIIVRVMGIVFLVFTIAMILRVLLTQRKVTHDSLVVTFCGYMLIGVVWAEIYMLLEFVDPGALHFIGEHPVLTDRPAERWLLLEYFSFTTLTTLGYGDIEPISPIARALACFEAILGQFYLAVLVAGLVGLRFASRPDHERPPTAAE
ncbi:MAG: potassium channel protein [Planctomycetaceae bacterium]|nr:potassium channel protein [Planctomycetaceae bacterium]